MTPAPPYATPPIKPSVLPLLALIFAVVGFCLPPLMLVAIVLAIVSLVKSNEAEFAPRRTLAIIALVLPVIWVPVVGVLAAIAIPNFVKFQSRSKQSECKVNLKSAYFGAQSAFAENDALEPRFEAIGFQPDPSNRYLYTFGKGEVIEARVGTTSTEALLGAIPESLENTLGVDGENFTIACAGNIDGDEAIDVWSISNTPRIVNGEQVPAGVAFNDLNDGDN